MAELYMERYNGEEYEFLSTTGVWREKPPVGDFNNKIHYRIKQKTVIINGFTVPDDFVKGLNEEKGSILYVETLSNPNYAAGHPSLYNDAYLNLCKERGILHTTKKGAIASCKARIGIDPNEEG